MSPGTALSLGSLGLGVLAWVLPVVSLWRILLSKRRGAQALSFFSLSACCLSLLLQISYQAQLAQLQKWVDIEDTIGGLAAIGGALVFVTIALNLAALMIGVYQARRR